MSISRFAFFHTWCRCTDWSHCCICSRIRTQVNCLAIQHKSGRRSRAGRGRWRVSFIFNLKSALIVACQYFDSVGSWRKGVWHGKLLERKNKNTCLISEAQNMEWTNHIFTMANYEQTQISCTVSISESSIRFTRLKTTNRFAASNCWYMHMMK